MCNYAHGEQELQPLPDLFKTKMCTAWLHGCCQEEKENCRFAHGSGDMRCTRSLKHNIKGAPTGKEDYRGKSRTQIRNVGTNSAGPMSTDSLNEKPPAMTKTSINVAVSMRGFQPAVAIYEKTLQLLSELEWLMDTFDGDGICQSVRVTSVLFQLFQLLPSSGDLLKDGVTAKMVEKALEAAMPDMYED